MLWPGETAEDPCRSESLKRDVLPADWPGQLSGDRERVSERQNPIELGSAPHSAQRSAWASACRRLHNEARPHERLEFRTPIRAYLAGGYPTYFRQEVSKELDAGHPGVGVRRVSVAMSSGLCSFASYFRRDGLRLP